MPKISSGVLNPFATAELLQGRRIRWDKLVDPWSQLEQILRMPRAEILDPDRSFVFSARGRHETRPTCAPHRSVSAHLAESGADLAVAEVDANLARLLEDRTPAASVRVLDALGLVARLDPTWKDMGDFFEEGPEVTDAVQGGTGDCYLIAALASVAWARPDLLLHRERVTGAGQEEFVDRVSFYESGVERVIEVTEKVKVSGSPAAFVFARSSESGEIWPAIYEKAYAKMISGTSSDTPDVAATIGGGGSPGTSLGYLTGKAISGWGTSGQTADVIWDTIRANSVSKRTVNPMAACTWAKDSDAPTTINSSANGIVNWHCYSILGWDYVNGVKCVVLRNPWGNTPAAASIAVAGTWSANNASWWQSFSMGNSGIFRISAADFKKYYAGYCASA